MAGCSPAVGTCPSTLNASLSSVSGTGVSQLITDTISRLQPSTCWQYGFSSLVRESDPSIPASFKNASQGSSLGCEFPQ